MTTIPSIATTPFPASSRPRAGLFARILAAIVEAQTRRAQHEIAGHLGRLDDSHLAALGFDAVQIQAIRTGEPVAHVIGRRRCSGA
jgi:hypothetical protein